MKKIIVFLLPIILLSFVFFTSCDKVKNPKQGQSNSSDTLVSPVIQTNAATRLIRKVLLEDYTGHFCGNCPRAARRAEVLAGTYGNKLVIMANHVSATFAAPQSEAGYYKEDFRNEDSDTWDVAFGMANKGLPQGGINRTKDASGTSYPQADGAWTTIIAGIINQPQSAIMDMKTAYDTIKHLLNVDVKTTFLMAVPAEVKLCVVLTQDGIVTDQKDYFPPANSTVVEDDIRPNYEFDHMVVRAINGTWGQTVKLSPSASDTASIHIKGFKINTDKFFNTQKTIGVNDRKMHAVAFIFRDDTKEVLQVETLKISGGSTAQ